MSIVKSLPALAQRRKPGSVSEAEVVAATLRLMGSGECADHAAFQAVNVHARAGQGQAKSFRSWAGRMGLGMLLLGSGVAQALENGVSSAGYPFMSGGIGESEQQAMGEAKPRFNLWVLTATRRTGAYLAGVHVRLTDKSGHLVFDRPLDGPQLLLALPAGNYALEAEFRDGEGAPLQRQKASVQVAAHGGRQLVLYFEAGGQPVDR
jgi:hypothetical protein